MKNILLSGFVLIAVFIACGVAVHFLVPGVNLPTVDYKPPSIEQPGLLTWRDPDADMAAFFPKATNYRGSQMVLTDLTVPIQERLGPDVPMGAYQMTVYRVQKGTVPRGSVMVERAAGEHGALEIVLGVGTDGKIAGVRLQSLREPPAVKKALITSRWLGAFRGLTAKSAFEVGGDLPDVPKPAEKTAKTIAQTVRTLMIKFDAGEHRAPPKRRLAGHAGA